MSSSAPPTQDRVEAYFKELNNWGRWGHDDQRGTVNLITPQKQAAAGALARTGRTVSIARPIVRQPILMYHTTFPAKRERVDIVLDRFDLVYHGCSPDALARACAEEGRYEFLFTATPIPLVGATGAPAHPIAIF